MEYGCEAIYITEMEFDWYEYMHYLYLPVQLPGTDIRIPPRLSFLETVVNQIVENEQHEGYVYVTARRGYATPGNPLNRPGWHADGFGTQDINYIWTDKYPTRFAEQHFRDISTDHVTSAEQFEEQVVPESVVTFPVNSLLRLDPYVVHCTPIIPAPGGERSFLKISLSNSKYNLLGNSHNYLFDYDWKMWSREEIRNDPAFAGGDSAPQQETTLVTSDES